MIDKNSLRLGNLVVLAHESNAPIGEVLEIGHKLCTVVVPPSKTFVRITYDLLLPIDLSEYWLERLADDWSPLNKEWKYRIQVGALNWFFRWNTEWYSELGGIYLDSKIKHLHQVQNIYFDLLGKEITFNMTNKNHQTV